MIQVFFIIIQEFMFYPVVILRYRLPEYINLEKKLVDIE